MGIPIWMSHLKRMYNFVMGGQSMNTRKINWMVLLLAGFLYILLSSGVHAADRVVVVPLGGGRPLKNVVTVAKAGSQFINPVAAMNSITDASATNPYLLLIAPGQYTLTSTLKMREYVDVTGSGENVTLLTGAISGNVFDENSAIVKGAMHATLSNLSIKNTGGHQYSFGIHTTGLGVLARLQQLTISVTGGSTMNAGVLNSSSSPNMSEVNVAVSGGVNNIGIYNISSSSPYMTGVNALVSGGGTNRGVFNYTSSPVMDGVNLYAWGGSGNNYGVFNESGSNSVKIRRSTLSGETKGLANSSSADTVISQSTIINGVSGSGVKCPGSDNNLGHLLDETSCL